jgi:hypothetical protein
MNWPGMSCAGMSIGPEQKPSKHVRGRCTAGRWTGGSRTAGRVVAGRFTAGSVTGGSVVPGRLVLPAAATGQAIAANS